MTQEDLLSIGSTIALGIASSLLFIFALTNPIYTWDTVAYTATILAEQIRDPQELQRATYSYLQERLNEAQFTALISGNYASALAENANHFYSQLGLYMVKPLYILAARLLTNVGLDPVTALHMLSLLPGITLCWVMFYWLRKFGSPPSALLLTLLFMIASRIIDTSRVPIPDNLSALLVFSGAFFLLAKNAWLPALTCLVLSVGVRTNNIIFTTLFLSLLSWQSWRETRQWRDRKFALSATALAVSLIAYLVITLRYDQQWWRLFYHTFVASQEDIGAFNIPFDLQTYFGVSASALRSLLASGQYINSTLPLFLIIFLLGIRSRWQSALHSLILPTDRPGLREISVLSLLVIAAFFVLFPLVANWDRFFLPFYGFFLLLAFQRTKRDGGIKN